MFYDAFSLWIAMKIILWFVAAATLLFLLDNLFLRMERRGWIYYRKKKPSRSSLGNAFLEIQSFLEPSKKNIVEVQKDEKKEEAESGDPPKAGEEA